MSCYKDLIVWQKSMELTTNIYKLTIDFPKEELYGLVSQIRRSAVSIPSNIAEGQARKYVQDFFHFLSIAQGSLAELETQILISVNLGYTTEDKVQSLYKEMQSIGKMITQLQKNINQQPVTRD